MPAISRDDAVAALVEVIRAALERGDAVHVPELGTFSVEHAPSHAEELPSGDVVMQPPSKRIVFAPDA